MAAHLVIIACLVAPPNTCGEVPLPDVTNEDVTTCIRDSGMNARKWQEKNMDKHVIGTKCVKTD
jgi:hypothetical protein